MIAGEDRTCAGHRGRSSLLLSVIVSAVLIYIPAPALGQDSLICRKRDQQSGPGATVTRLGPGADYFNAGPGPDIVYGGKGSDIINGGRGNDVVYGGPGDDTVCGGVGRDSVFGSAGRDSVFGEEGNDRASGGPGADYIAGQAGRDKLIGFGKRHGEPVSDGKDFLEGSYNADVLIIGGKDEVSAGVDNDLVKTATPQLSEGRVDGGLGDDRIFGSEMSDRDIFGGQGDNIVYGLGGDDVLRGDNGSEKFFGGDGNDVIYSRSGGDHISGGDGFDTCYGLAMQATFDPSCEEAVAPVGDDDPGKQRTFQQLKVAEQALQQVSVDGRRTVAGLRNELAILTGGTASLEVIFAFSDEERHNAFRYIETQYDPTVTYLLLGGESSSRPGPLPIPAPAVFAAIAPSAHVFCSGERPQLHEECP